MKELRAAEAMSALTDSMGNYAMDEVTSFAKSEAQVAELDYPQRIQSPRVAGAAFRAAAKRLGFDFFIMVREDRVIAYKKEAYKALKAEISAKKYAERVISEVAQKEALSRFLSDCEF